MASGSRVPIAERNASGGLEKLATLGISPDYTTFEIVEADNTRHEYQLPENSSLAFQVQLENVEGGRQRTLMEETGTPVEETLAIELTRARFKLPKLLLEKATNEQGEHLTLSIIGETEEDVQKPALQVTLPMLSALNISFRRATDTLLVKVLFPPKA